MAISSQSQFATVTPMDDAPAHLLGLRLIVAYSAFVGTLIFAIGVAWDIQWHAEIGRDRTFTPPHLVILAGITLCGLVTLGEVVVETMLARRSPAVRVVSTPFAPGFYAPLGTYLAGFGALLAAVAFPLDNFWHALYGIDVRLWAPFHIMSIAAMALCGIGIVALFATIAHLAKTAAGRNSAFIGAVCTTSVAFTSALILLSPALGRQGIVDLGIAIPLWPLLFGAIGVFFLYLTVLVIPWPLMATAMTAIMLVVRQLMAIFVPPAITWLVQAEQQTPIRLLSNRVDAAASMSPFLLFVALALDGVVFFARRQHWQPRTRFWVLVSAMTLVITVLVLVALRATNAIVRHLSGSIIIVMVVALIGVLGGEWMSARLGAAFATVRQ